jgi:hypothetical protein
VEWSAELNNLSISDEFRVTSSLICNVGNVNRMLTDTEAACAALAMFHGVLPGGITTQTAIMSANAPDIATMEKWLVFKTVPAHGGHTRPYLTLGLVLAPKAQDGSVISIEVAVINPMRPYDNHVRVQWDTLVNHWAQDNVFGPPVNCKDGFGAACDPKNNGVNTVGAVLFHAATIMHHGSLWSERVTRKWSVLVRNVAKQALHAHRYNPASGNNFRNDDIGDIRLLSQAQDNAGD